MGPWGHQDYLGVEFEQWSFCGNIRYIGFTRIYNIYIYVMSMSRFRVETYQNQWNSHTIRSDVSLSNPRFVLLKSSCLFQTLSIKRVTTSTIDRFW